jgi:hypothetical protein
MVWHGYPDGWVAEGKEEEKKNFHRKNSIEAKENNRKK